MLGRMSLTPTDLREIYDSQGGRCALSGMPLDIAEAPSHANRRPSGPWKISIDRLDNSLGYVKGNVRLVTQMANLCRNVYSDDDVRTFAKAVVANL